jgi:hypothetical protein
MLKNEIMIFLKDLGIACIVAIIFGVWTALVLAVDLELIGQSDIANQLYGVHVSFVGVLKIVLMSIIPALVSVSIVKFFIRTKKQ